MPRRDIVRSATDRCVHHGDPAGPAGLRPAPRRCGGCRWCAAPAPIPTAWPPAGRSSRHDAANLLVGEHAHDDGVGADRDLGEQRRPGVRPFGYRRTLLVVAAEGRGRCGRPRPAGAPSGRPSGPPTNPIFIAGCPVAPMRRRRHRAPLRVRRRPGGDVGDQADVPVQQSAGDLLEHVQAAAEARDAGQREAVASRGRSPRRVSPVPPQVLAEVSAVLAVARCALNNRVVQRLGHPARRPPVPGARSARRSWRDTGRAFSTHVLVAADHHQQGAGLHGGSAHPLTGASITATPLGAGPLGEVAAGVQVRCCAPRSPRAQPASTPSSRVTTSGRRRRRRRTGTPRRWRRRGLGRRGGPWRRCRQAAPPIRDGGPTAWSGVPPRRSRRAIGALAAQSDESHPHQAGLLVRFGVAALFGEDQYPR